MDPYNSLIRRVLNDDTLVKHINEFADDDTINLVTPAWQKELENNSFYQRLKKGVDSFYSSEKLTYNKQFRVQNLKKESIKVIVVANCSIYRSYDKSTNKYFSVNIRECPALIKISAAMNSDVKGVERGDTSKVNFGACTMFCKYCSEAREEMLRQGVYLEKSNFQSCIVKTAVYDGNWVMNRFSSQLSQMFEGQFVALLKIDINHRYFYRPKDNPKDWVRIGGNAIRMIAFPESNLYKSEIFVGGVEKMWNPVASGEAAEKTNSDDDIYDVHAEPLNDITLETPSKSENNTLWPTFNKGATQKRSLNDSEDEIVDVFSSKALKGEQTSVRCGEIAVEENVITFN